MAKYTLTSQRLGSAHPNYKTKVWDWLIANGAPDMNAIAKIELFPLKKEVIYYLATGVSDDMEITTIPFPMPMKTRPNWIDICTMSEV